MKRRHFVGSAGALGALAGPTSWSFAQSQNSQHKADDTTNTPKFYIDAKNNGRVYYYDENHNQQDVLQHTRLTSKHDFLEYNPQSSLRFVNESSSENPVGILCCLRSLQAPPQKSLFADSNIFQFLKFGFLLWNSTTKNLELSAVLKQETQIYDTYGYETHLNLADSHCIGILSPQNSGYEFGLILLHAKSSPTLSFLAFDSAQNAWILLQEESIGEELNLDTTDLINITTHWLPSENPDFTNKLLQLTIPSHGVLLYEFNLASANNSLAIQKRGFLPHGSYLDDQWEFRAGNPLENEEHRDVFLGAFVQKNQSHLHLYFTKNKIKTICWERDNFEHLTAKAVHSDSFDVKENELFFFLKQKNKAQGKTALLSFHKENGFGLIQTEQNTANSRNSFVKIPLDAVNHHHKMKNLLHHLQGKDSADYDIVLTNTRIKNRNKNDLDSSLQENTQENSSYEFTISYIVNTPSGKKKQSSTTFTLSHEGQVTGYWDSDHDDEKDQDEDNDDDKDKKSSDITLITGAGIWTLLGLYFWAKSHLKNSDNQLEAVSLGDPESETDSERAARENSWVVLSQDGTEDPNAKPIGEPLGLPALQNSAPEHNFDQAEFVREFYSEVSATYNSLVILKRIANMYGRESQNTVRIDELIEFYRHTPKNHWEWADFVPMVAKKLPKFHDYFMQSLRTFQGFALVCMTSEDSAQFFDNDMLLDVFRFYYCAGNITQKYTRVPTHIYSDAYFLTSQSRQLRQRLSQNPDFQRVENTVRQSAFFSVLYLLNHELNIYEKKRFFDALPFEVKHDTLLNMKDIISRFNWKNDNRHNLLNAIPETLDQIDELESALKEREIHKNMPLPIELKNFNDFTRFYFYLVYSAHMASPEFQHQETFRINTRFFLFLSQPKEHYFIMPSRIEIRSMQIQAYRHSPSNMMSFDSFETYRRAFLENSQALLLSGDGYFEFNKIPEFEIWERFCL